MNRFSCRLSEKKRDGRERERERERDLRIFGKIASANSRLQVGDATQRDEELIFNEARRGSCFRKGNPIPLDR